MIRLALVVLPLAALAAQSEAKKADPPAPPPRSYAALWTGTPPAIDGKLDDDAWKLADWSEPFADIEGGDKPKPRHQTRMKMCWDGEALYICAKLDEPHVWANLTEHDAVIFQDPDFEAFVDPEGDGLLYGELELNARNTTWDLLLTKPYRDKGKPINGWEVIGLQTAVRVEGTLNDPRDTDTGWTVEVKWPWKGLAELGEKEKFPPKPGDKHRINFSRVQWDFDIVNGKYVKIKGRPEHNWVWSPQGVIDMHRPERWGTVEYTAAPKK